MRGRLDGKALAAQIIARGNDGVSPVVSVENIDGGHRITIEDIRGIKSFEVKDGEGLNVLGSYATEEELIAAHPTGNAGDGYLIEGNLFVWDEITESWLNVGNIKGEKGDKGEDGKDGVDGSDGYTPIKGTDYFTESEKQEIVESAREDMYSYDTEDLQAGVSPLETGKLHFVYE